MLPSPYVTPKVLNALAELVLSLILAMDERVKVMTPSKRPESARRAIAAPNDVTRPSAAVRTAVIALDTSRVGRNPSLSPALPHQ